MTFDGDSESSIADKVAAVKGFVKSVMDVISSSKERQLAEEVMKADMRGELAYATEEDTDAGAILMDASESSEVSLGSGSGRSGGARRERTGRTAPIFENMALSMAPQSAAAPFGAPPAASTALASAAQSSRPPSRPPSRASSRPPSRAMMMAKRAMTPTIELTDEAIQPGSTPSTAEVALAQASKSSGGEDFTLIPKLLDAKLEKLDADNALRSTIIKAGTTWTRMRQQNLLIPSKSSSLAPAMIQEETKKAFDLLDAISRSGSLPIACADLHVVVAVSHCFENDVMGTIIQDNINPIEKVERSSLMLAGTIHGAPTKQLVQDERQVERLSNTFPVLFVEDE